MISRRNFIASSGLTLMGAAAVSGRAQAAAVVRYGVADEKLSGEVSFQRQTVNRAWRLSGYHQLTPMDPATTPFTLASSLNAFLIGLVLLPFAKETTGQPLPA